jgi:hypothetical protein
MISSAYGTPIAAMVSNFDEVVGNTADPPPQGLYAGYKRRNAQLDKLTANTPRYIAESNLPLEKARFTDIGDLDALEEIRQWLWKQYALLSQVIEARTYHHTRFYSLRLDYGHEAHIEKLREQRLTVNRLLRRVDKRMAELLHQQQKWFKWVEQCQDEDKVANEKEKEKVRLEAAMFKRQCQRVAARLRSLREKEERQRQDAFLEEAYQENMLMDANDPRWDPIEDVVEEEHGNYVDLVKYFLWMESETDDHVEDTQAALSVLGISDVPEKGRQDSVPKGTPGNASSNGNATSSKKKRSKAKKPSTSADVLSTKTAPPIAKPSIASGKQSMESKSDMERRLRGGFERTPLEEKGPYLNDDVTNLVIGKNPPMPEDELQEILAEVAEIKQFLFCRLLLAHATLLPVAMRTESVEAFLADKEISNNDLRDLCIRLERPRLQDIRDACADIHRSDEEDTDISPEDSDEDDPVVKKGLNSLCLFTARKEALEEWVPKSRDRADEELPADLFNEQDKDRVEFGIIDDQGVYTKRKMRVKVCGRDIWNYASQTAMNRKGWLHFSIIAKDCSLLDAVQLCRTWDEFFELNTLASLGYFPAADWHNWMGNQMTKQFLQLVSLGAMFTCTAKLTHPLQGLIPFAKFEHAAQTSFWEQSGSRSSQFRRQHEIQEARNYLCAQMKRNDPLTRRFIQYLVMRRSDLVVLVRDGKTNRIITKPYSDQLWLKRKKSGLGRASKKEWTIVEEVNEEWFEMVDAQRRWKFSLFNDYYDLYIWDLQPGRPHFHLHETISMVCTQPLSDQRQMDPRAAQRGSEGSS